MAITNTDQYSASWVTPERCSSVEYFVKTVENLEMLLPFGSPSNVSISLQGSMAAKQIAGDIASVRKDLDQINNRNFSTCSLQAQFTSAGNMNLNMILSTSIRQITINLKNTNEPNAESAYEALRKHFPGEFGFSYDELSDKARKIEDIAGESNKVKTLADKIENHFKQSENNLSQAREYANRIESLLGQSRQNKDDSDSALKIIKDSNEEVNKTLAEIKNTKGKVEADYTAIIQTRDRVDALKQNIENFSSLVDKNNKVIDGLVEKSRATINKFQGETESIIDKNQKLQMEIDEQLLKAVGASIFSAFEKRKSKIIISKWIWACLVFVTCLMQAGAVVWLVYDIKGIANGSSLSANPFIEPLFLLKLTIALPILFLIGFCVKQYANERHYEEIYGFKSSLSFSLAPYLDLIKQTYDLKNGKEYESFLVKTVEQMFHDPIRLKSGRDDKNLLPEKTLSDIVKSLTDLVSNIKK